jgi:hypothetical protein
MNDNEWLEETQKMGVETWASERGEMPKLMPLYEVMGSYAVKDFPFIQHRKQVKDFCTHTIKEIGKTFIYPNCVQIKMGIDQNGLVYIDGLFHISDVWLDTSNEMLNVIMRARAELHGIQIAGAFGFRRYVMYMEVSE